MFPLNNAYLKDNVKKIKRLKWLRVKRLKDNKGKTVLNAFIEKVNESNRKPNKLWVDQGREFDHKLMQE